MAIQTIHIINTFRSLIRNKYCGNLKLTRIECWTQPVCVSENWEFFYPEYDLSQNVISLSIGQVLAHIKSFHGDPLLYFYFWSNVNQKAKVI